MWDTQLPCLKKPWSKFCGHFRRVSIVFSGAECTMLSFLKGCTDTYTEIMLPQKLIQWLWKTTSTLDSSLGHYRVVRLVAAHSRCLWNNARFIVRFDRSLRKNFLCHHRLLGIKSMMKVWTVAAALSWKMFCKTRSFAWLFSEMYHETRS